MEWKKLGVVLQFPVFLFVYNLYNYRENEDYDYNTILQSGAVY